LFRFPELRHAPELLAYLASRNIGIFSTDADSFDFRTHQLERVVSSVMTNLKKNGKGIVLMHDFQHSTALTLPELLLQLKANGYRIVQVKTKARRPHLLPTINCWKRNSVARPSICGQSRTWFRPSAIQTLMIAFLRSDSHASFDGSAFSPQDRAHLKRL
jgi:hypothetical protein